MRATCSKRTSGWSLRGGCAVQGRQAPSEPFDLLDDARVLLAPVEQGAQRGFLSFVTPPDSR